MGQINSIAPAILTWILSQTGGRGKNIFLRNFFAEPIFAKGRKPNIVFCTLFFRGKQHLVPGINHFRKW